MGHFLERANYEAGGLHFYHAIAYIKCSFRLTQRTVGKISRNKNSGLRIVSQTAVFRFAGLLCADFGEFGLAVVHQREIVDVQSCALNNPKVQTINCQDITV